MRATAWTIAVVAAAFATLVAMLDSALLAFHAGKSAGAPTEAELLEREHLHRALSMSGVLAYVVAGAAFADALSLASAGLAWRVVAAVACAVVVCTLSEGMGRAIGYARAPATYARFLPTMRLLLGVLRPVVALGAAIDHALRVAAPPPPATVDTRETSAEQFREVVTEAADVSSAEERLIHGVFSLGDTEVHEIMVPRVDIVGVDAATPWSEVLDRIRSAEHARFPVFRDTLDDVTGILYAKDVLPAMVLDEEPAAGWLSLARPPAFIPISKRIDAQLREFQASRSHIAIVSDEFGGTAGLVTIEDILEEIVGEIRDEHDVEEPQIRQEGGSRFWVSSRLPVDELSERLDTAFHVDDVTTVGGLVYALFGRVPRAGESLVHDGFRIVVERVVRRRIERVYFERIEPANDRAGGRE
jgi:CBS domain containing-hemolysin-like protein